MIAGARDKHAGAWLWGNRAGQVGSEADISHHSLVVQHISELPYSLSSSMRYGRKQ